MKENMLTSPSLGQAGRVVPIGLERALNSPNRMARHLAEKYLDPVFVASGCTNSEYIDLERLQSIAKSTGHKISYPEYIANSPIWKDAIKAGRVVIVELKGIIHNGTELSVSTLDRLLKTAYPPETPFVVFIDSPGGSVVAMNALMEVLAQQRSVTTVALSRAYSAAFEIWWTGTNRLTSPYTDMLAHSARTYIEEGVLSPGEWKRTGDWLLALEKRLWERYPEWLKQVYTWERFIEKIDIFVEGKDFIERNQAQAWRAPELTLTFDIIGEDEEPKTDPAGPPLDAEPVESYTILSPTGVKLASGRHNGSLSGLAEKLFGKSVAYSVDRGGNHATFKIL